MSMLFTPANLGNLTLKNRTIRSAAFEGMCPGNEPAESLFRYHECLAEGGVAMTTIGYASINRRGLSFSHQLLVSEEHFQALTLLTERIHRKGALVSIQLCHGGLMASRGVSGGRPLAPSTRINLYGPTFPRQMREAEIRATIQDYGRAAQICMDAGFDALEIHAGHGYLISQFLSPYTNHRKDQWGGSFENRCRLMVEVIREIKKRAGSKVPVLVKINMRDGFRGGMEVDEGLEVARLLEQEGVDGLILSGGFVCKAPMYVMRGRMPLKEMSSGVRNRVIKYGMRIFGGMLMREVPFQEVYFLEDALKFRREIHIPLIYVGGLIRRETSEYVLSMGFDFVAYARALIQDPYLVSKMEGGAGVSGGCAHTNYCIAVMYTGEIRCIQQEKGQG